MMSASTNSNSDSELSVGRIASQVLELASLQVKLLLADVKAGMLTARVAVALAALGLALLVASAPVALMALAFWLRDAQGFSTPAALAITAAAGTAVACVFGFAAWQSSKKSVRQIARSFEDFEKNLTSLAPDDETWHRPTNPH